MKRSLFVVLCVIGAAWMMAACTPPPPNRCDLDLSAQATPPCTGDWMTCVDGLATSDQTACEDGSLFFPASCPGTFTAGADCSGGTYTGKCDVDASTIWFLYGDCGDYQYSNQWGCQALGGTFTCLGGGS